MSGDLSGLPAAVEVTAYRIVAESLANTVRHAGARSCSVTVDRHRWLDIEICDDGIGIPADAFAGPGLGLASMRDRAAELGGELTLDGPASGGTTVRVRLPLTEPADAAVENAGVSR
jgi:two-component system, NarL family, sensor kinase